MYGVLLSVLADDSVVSSPGMWGLLGTALVAGSGIAIAAIQRSRSVTREEEADAEGGGRIIAARVAAESTVETALESWDRIIGQPQREEILELRKLLDRARGELSDSQAQLGVSKDQCANLQAQLSQAHNEINRLLKALVKRNGGDGGGHQQG